MKTEGTVSFENKYNLLIFKHSEFELVEQSSRHEVLEYGRKRPELELNFGHHLYKGP